MNNHMNNHMNNRSHRRTQMQRPLLCLLTAAMALSISACGPSPTSPFPSPSGTALMTYRSSVSAQGAAYDASGVSVYPQAAPTPAPSAEPSAAPSGAPQPSATPSAAETANTESYQRIYENPFLATLQNPLSTFSIDVDTASYSNVRRYIQQQGQLPPADAVRIEELINYFRFDYPQPSGEHPFSISTELSECPWKPEHQLLRVGLQAQQLDFSKAPHSNLVFLLDVSGSMSDPNKLPLLKQSLRLLVDQLREQDKVSIVVYAGAAGVVLPATTGDRKESIIAALDKLEAGGSTAGGEGLRLAYKVAQDNFIPGGNNRIILATDGDFNVGESSDAAMARLVEDKRKQGVFLTTLGYGMGNYKDSTMETLANKGNGNYAYIDSIAEARKVLVQEMGASLLTLAKDVKLQLEFNPAKVASYRLIGYENRLLAAEDFDNDAKDAGELGAGHTVTALYELVPATGEAAQNSLTYTETQIKENALASKDLLTLKLRYKQPNSETSQLLSQSVSTDSLSWSTASADLHFAASVAGFGMLLRNSEHKGNLNFEKVLQLGREGKGQDPNGYRAAYLELVQAAQRLK